MVLRWKKFPNVLNFFDYIRLGIGTDMLIPPPVGSIYFERCDCCPFFQEGMALILLGGVSTSKVTSGRLCREKLTPTFTCVTPGRQGLSNENTKLVRGKFNIFTKNSRKNKTTKPNHKRTSYIPFFDSQWNWYVSPIFDPIKNQSNSWIGKFT